MDWITRDRLAAQAQVASPTKGSAPSKRQALGLPNREAVAIPAADGKRVLVSQPWQGSKRQASPCISFNINDPTNVHLFTASRSRQTRDKAQATKVAQVPDVVKFREIIGTHNLTED